MSRPLRVEYPGAFYHVLSRGNEKKKFLEQKRTKGRYKSILVQKDAYLHYLSRYIHLNPVRANIVKVPHDYPRSSYIYFLSDKMNNGFLITEDILSMFSGDTEKAKNLYREFIEDNIGNETEVIKENITGGFILGTTDFVGWIKK